MFLKMVSSNEKCVHEIIQEPHVMTVCPVTDSSTKAEVQSRVWKMTAAFMQWNTYPLKKYPILMDILFFQGIPLNASL